MTQAEEFVEETQAFWEGAFSWISSDAPDGAWFQMHVDTVELNLGNWADIAKDLGFKSSTKGFDAHDVVMAYFELIGDPA